MRDFILIYPSFYSQIVVVIFGCAEFLMGCQLSTEVVGTSFSIYIPLWQGLLVHNVCQQHCDNAVLDWFLQQNKKTNRLSSDGHVY